MASGEVYLSEHEARVLHEALAEAKRRGLDDRDLLVADDLLYQLSAIASSEPVWPKVRPELGGFITEMEVEVVSSRPFGPGRDFEYVAEAVIAGGAHGRVVSATPRRVNIDDVAEAMQKMGKDPALVLGAYWDDEE